ncbi:OmpA family protein [Nonomuraea sp. SYSU D8015]|uniref:OmpA family protein n=1 Tax=Nonomuraea sp. SYSU D8015 TaxID=2593644 RepID=UPI001660CB9C|nr:OmpA family protein [Nonomuraea sp. SYSU D8015]
MYPSARSSATFLSVAALLGLSLTACAEGGEGPSTSKLASLGCGMSGDGPLALAVGSHANAPAPAIEPALVELMKQSAQAGHRISLVRIDGAPAVVFDAPFKSDAGNDVALEKDVNSYLTAVEQKIKGDIRAKAPEVDVLTAFTLAARSTEPGGNIVLIDPGLQTTTPLDFREVIDAEPADVVAYLRKQELIPDLTGRKVLLSGLGDTASPQPEPDLRLRRNIVAIWKEIAQAGGAACVAVDGKPNDQAAPTGAPPVSVVPLPSVRDTFSACGEADLSDGNHVGFVRGTSKFRDVAGARKTLANLADTIRKDDLRVKLIGSTSSEGTREGNLRLSRERAQAVKRELVLLGVPRGSITAEGHGAQWPGRVDDLAPDGTLLPGPAARNRKVIARLTCPAT